MKKGEKLKSMLFSWPVEKLGARATTPPAENADVSAFEGDTEGRIYNRAQRFWRTPRVSVISDTINDTAGDFGKFNHQVTKKIKDQKADIESVFLSNQDSNDDNGTVGTRTLGLARIINDGATLTFGDAQTAIPAAYRTPLAQIYTGTLAALDEATFATILKARFDALGQTYDLVMIAGSSLKAQISLMFGNYKPNLTNYTVIVRTMSQAIDSRKFAGYGPDMYQGDFGNFEIVASRYIQDTKWGYGLNMDYMTMRPAMYCEFTELPYQGGGRSGLVDSILGFEFGDPRGHFKIQAT
jgi:hypothetical protein